MRLDESPMLHTMNLPNLADHVLCIVAVSVLAAILTEAQASIGGYVAEFGLLRSPTPKDLSY